MITVAIVDDHKMFRDGVKSMLEETKDFKMLWSASNSKETIEQIELNTPEIILMDITLGKESGIKLTEQLLVARPNLKVIAISMHYEESYIVKILEIGAKGYLLKDAGGEEMVNAITAVYNGGTYYSNYVSQVLIKHITSGTKPTDKVIKSPLTKREEEILTLIANEYSNSEIAKQLYISIRTVDTHRRNLLDKLEVKNTAGLVRYAIKLGLVDIQ